MVRSVLRRGLLLMVAATLFGAGSVATGARPAAAAGKVCKNGQQDCADIYFQCRIGLSGGLIGGLRIFRECRGEGWAGYFTPGDNLYVELTAYEWDFQTVRMQTRQTCMASAGDCYADSGWYKPWAFGPPGTTMGNALPVLFCVHAGRVGQPASDVGTCSVANVTSSK